MPTRLLLPPRSRGLAVVLFGALSMVGVGAGGMSFSAAQLTPGAVVPTMATYLVESVSVATRVPFVPTGWRRGDTSGDATDDADR
jgi:hypothetical protein